jgi:muramidase (phage lysozyme)
MLAGYFMPGENEKFSYEDLDRRKRMAEALMAQGADYSPVKSWTQGAARIAQALSGSLQQEYASRLDKQRQSAYGEMSKPIRDALAGGQSGGAMPSAPAMGGGSSLPSMASGGSIPKMIMPDPVSGNLDITQKALLNAIAAPESAGAYNIRYTPKGGATFAGFDAHPGVFEPGPAGPSSAAGRYQFTKTTWDRMGGGAFTPENQDQRALALASQDYKSRTGRELMADIQANGFTPQIAQALGPTWRGLVDNPQKAMAAFQATMQRGQQAPVQTAQTGTTPDGMPTSPVASDALPMAYAPAQQAIAGAMPQAGGPPMPPRRPESFGGAPMPVDTAQQPAQGQRLAQAVTSPPIPAPQPTGNVQQAMMAVLSDPRFSPQQKSQAMQMFQMTQRDEGVTTVDLGDRIALMNKRGQVTGYMPKTQAPRGPMALGPDQRLVDPTTGKEIAGATGGMKPPRVEKIKQADGSEVSVQWDEKQGVFVPLKAPEGGNPVANPKLTEGQSKDLNYALRGEDLLPLLEEQDKALTEFFSANASKVPVVGNLLKSDQYRQAEQTGRELLAAILRKDTGAAVTEGEMSLYSGMYLPQPGDDQKTIEQKRAGRSRAIEGIKLGIGPARILLEQRKSLDSNKPKADAKDAAPARKTLRGKTYEKRGSDWFEVQ